MRSLLFVPGDSDRKLARGLASGADVLLVDLEDSVAPAAKGTAREQARIFLQAARAGGMKCIAVTFVGHHSADAVRLAGADLVVPTLEQVSVAMVQGLFG